MMSWLIKVIVHVLYTLTCALPPDSTLTVQNVARALTGMAYDYGFSINLGVPDSSLTDIEHHYSTDDQRNLAVIEYYLHYAPGASWSHLAGQLYYREKEGALQHVQKYVQRPAGMTSLLITCIFIPINYHDQIQIFLSGYFLVCQMYMYVPHMYINTSGALLLHGVQP